ncbi:MAG: right-handed parallel beta-helix repeat-containing protein [Candidatus Bipolaricaulota bacterium]|nr:right-handed parallel beta-helix repeat-containing protein [Candidatus Bipolaricaulota bacterium]
MRRCSLLAVGVVGLAIVGGWGLGGAQQPVSVDCARESLQKAIDRAAPNTEITVTGTCKENLYITKDLTLRGPSATLTSVSPYLPVVAVTNGKVFLLGEPGKPLTITGGDRGVVTIGKDAHVVLDHVTVQENTWGGVLIADGKATIQNSTISNTGVGIAVLDRAEIVNNTITNNRGCGVWAISKAQGWAVDAHVSGSGNTMSANKGGDLCPADFKWPTGFKR